MLRSHRLSRLFFNKRNSRMFCTIKPSMNQIRTPPSSKEGPTLLDFLAEGSEAREIDMETAAPVPYLIDHSPGIGRFVLFILINYNSCFNL